MDILSCISSRPCPSSFIPTLFCPVILPTALASPASNTSSIFAPYAFPLFVSSFSVVSLLYSATAIPAASSYSPHTFPSAICTLAFFQYSFSRLPSFSPYSLSLLLHSLNDAVFSGRMTSFPAFICPTAVSKSSCNILHDTPSTAK